MRQELKLPGGSLVVEVEECSSGDGYMIVEYMAGDTSAVAKSVKCCCGSGSDRKCVTGSCPSDKTPTCRCSSSGPRITCD